MIYPNNYEQKIGFDEIRRLLKGHCQSSLGQEKVDEIEKALLQSSVREAVSRVKVDARVAVLTAGNQENPNFAVLLNAWIKQKHPENELFLNEVRQFLNNVIR